MTFCSRPSCLKRLVSSSMSWSSSVFPTFRHRSTLDSSTPASVVCLQHARALLVRLRQLSPPTVSARQSLILSTKTVTFFQQQFPCVSSPFYREHRKLPQQCGTISHETQTGRNDSEETLSISGKGLHNKRQGLRYITVCPFLSTHTHTHFLFFCCFRENFTIGVVATKLNVTVNMEKGDWPCKYLNCIEL